MLHSATNRRNSLLPIVLAGALPFALSLLPGPGFEPRLALAGAALTVVVGAIAALVAWDRVPDWWALVPALGYLVVVAILREAGGGNSSGLGPLVLLPVIWLALVSSRRVLAVAIVSVAFVYWAPIVLDGPGDRYPTSGWRIGTLFTCVAALLGITVHRLLSSVRAQAAVLGRLALTDELTQLPNRRAWNDALGRAIADAERFSTPLAVALVDLDGFKDINDRHGHHAGDEVLVEAARRWSALLRRSDVLARTGGDEFALLLPGTALEDAHAIVARLHEEVQPLVRCSIGLVARDVDEPAGLLLARADRRLYEAKHGGRDRVAHDTLPLPQ